MTKKKKKAPAKKSAKPKKVAKKQPKQVVEVSIRRETLGKAPEEHHFIVTDGSKLKDLKELADALDKMTDDVFKHHVNDFKNDFSSWVRDIFDEEKLADELAMINNRMAAQAKVLRHIIKKLEGK